MDTYNHKRAISVIDTTRKLEDTPQASTERNKFRKDDKVFGGILWAIVKPKFLRYSLYWMRKWEKYDKKGLKVIGWIYKHKGENKIKRNRNSSTIKTNQHRGLNTLTFEKALLDMRVNNFKSSYGMFYGRKPDLTDLSDTEVLKK